MPETKKDFKTILDLMLKYGHHQIDCDRLTRAMTTIARCTCGFDEARLTCMRLSKELGK